MLKQAILISNILDTIYEYSPHIIHHNELAPKTRFVISYFTDKTNNLKQTHSIETTTSLIFVPKTKVELPTHLNFFVKG